MAKCSYPLTLLTRGPGLLAAFIITGSALFAFFALCYYAPFTSWQTIYQQLLDPYLWHIIRFTFWQAGCSTLVAVLPAIPLALAFSRRMFCGRRLLLKLYAMALVLPVLVAIFGLLTVYGQHGWLAIVYSWFNYPYHHTLYGLQGIVLVHLFFNLPFATQILLMALQQIAPEQRQLAAQLGMSVYQRFRFIEWPVLQRQCIVSAALIFMLCFTSFAAVLTLGGGPKATTLELAVYQAIRYDFDLPHAALFALLQLFFCIIIMQVGLVFRQHLPVDNSYQKSWYSRFDPIYVKIGDYLLILIASLFILSPLCATLLAGVNSDTLTTLLQPSLWRAVMTSLIIALGAGTVAVTLSLMLLWSSRQLSLNGQHRAADWLELTGMTPLAMPAIILATGFFLLCVYTTGLPQSPYGLIIFVNGIMAIPFCLRILHPPMYSVAQRYTLLALSLGIKGWQRFRLIDAPLLRQPIAHAFALACLLSLGDFGIIALFGNESFTTLPLYLYQQLSAYRTQASAVTALLLLLFCFVIFTTITGLSDKYDRS